MTLSRTFPYLYKDLTGEGAPPSTLLTQSGFQQDGVSYFGSLLEPRTLDFKAVIQSGDRSNLMAMRDKIMRVFNPRLGKGVLLYNNGEADYRIEGAVYDGPHPIKGAGNESATMQSFDIGIYCPRPAWTSHVQYAEKLVGFIGGLRLPYRIPYKLAEHGDKKVIDYQETLAAPLLVEFRGPATMPRITLEETGLYIESTLEILEGEKLFVDTFPYNFDAYKEDVNGNRIPAMNYISGASAQLLLKQDFVLSYGINTLSFIAASGNPEVYLYWRKQYPGV